MKRSEIELHRGAEKQTTVRRRDEAKSSSTAWLY
jgi:hypothetical protein